MLVLVLVAAIAAVLHYQLLDGLVERFGLGTEASSGTIEPGGASTVAKKSASEPKSAPEPEPEPVPEPNPAPKPKQPTVSSPDMKSGTADLVRADEIRRIWAD